MPYIVLTEEQARIIAEAKNGVEVRGPEGEVIAFFKPISPEESAHIAEALRRHAQRDSRTRRGVPASLVEAMLQKFHEIDRTEGMTREKSQELIRRTITGEPL